MANTLQYENHPFQPAPVSRKSDQTRHDTSQHRKQAARPRHAERQCAPSGATIAEYAQYRDRQPPAKSRQPRKTRHSTNPNQEK